MSFLKMLIQKLKSLISDDMLCDTCMYDYGNACTREERPNAQVCADYKRR